MVPNDWSLSTFDNAGIIVTDGDRGKEYPKAIDFFEDEYCLFLSAKNVTKQGFLFEDNQFITEAKHRKLRKGTVNKGDVVLTTRGSVGHFALYDESIGFKCMRINSGMVTLSFSNASVESDYFYTVCRSYLVSNQIEAVAFGSAQPQLTVKLIKNLKLPVPPLPEQRKIAKILSTWDKAISTTEKLIKTSKQQKKALMQQLFTGRKRLRSSPKDGAETGKAFEGEWEEVNIASRFELITDYVASGSFASLKENVNVQDIESYAHYVRQTDLAAKFNNKKLKWVDKDSYDFLNKSNLFEGDILFTNIGDLGKVFYMPKLIKPATVAPNLVVLRTNQSNDSRFIYYMLASDVGQREIEKIKSGTGLPKINKTEFKTMKFRIPHLEEQQRIASVLTAADKEIEVLEVKLAHFKQEKKALMQQLLTGKRRVKVDEEVAA